jgi:hypothetical protein
MVQVRPGARKVRHRIAHGAVSQDCRDLQAQWNLSKTMRAPVGGVRQGNRQARTMLLGALQGHEARQHKSAPRGRRRCVSQWIEYAMGWDGDEKPRPAALGRAREEGIGH